MAEEKKERRGALDWTSLRGGMWIMLFSVLGGAILQHALQMAAPSAVSNLKAASVAVGTIAFLAVAILGFRRKARGFLGSVRFAAPVLTFVTIHAVLGTLIVQGAAPEAFDELYGPTMAWLLRMMHLQDIFHSYGFAAILGGGAGGVLLALLPLRPMTPSRFARLLAHLSLIVILAGTSIGAVWGVKGQMALREGESSNRFFVPASGGAGMKELPLGFTLRLERFRLDLYDPSYRLRIFEVVGESEPKLIASADPAKEGGERRKLEKHGITIASYWPDFEQVVEAVPADDKEAGGSLPPVSALRLTRLDGKGKRAWLFATAEGTPETVEVTGKGALGFAWSEERALAYVASLAGVAEEKHLLTLGDTSMAVKVGERYPLPDGLILKIEKFFNDFVIDIDTKEASNRSDEPANPALRVVVEDGAGTVVDEGWLFANFASAHGAKEGSPLAAMTYAYTPGRKPGAADEILVVAETRQVWTLRDGQVAEKAPLILDGKTRIGGLGLAAAELLPEAKIVTKNLSRSKTAKNPVVEIGIEGRDRTLLLQAESPVEISEGKVLVLSPQEENVRDFLSTLSVVEEGSVVMTRTIEVNYPLSYGGYVFYQASYDPNRPGWTGLEVVTDPGIMLVYIGLIMLLAGVALVVFVVPLLKRPDREKSSDRVTEPPRKAAT
jgi:hypothetical protein